MATSQPCINHSQYELQSMIAELQLSLRTCGWTALDYNHRCIFYGKLYRGCDCSLFANNTRSVLLSCYINALELISQNICRVSFLAQWVYNSLFPIICNQRGRSNYKWSSDWNFYFFDIPVFNHDISDLRQALDRSWTSSPAVYQSQWCNELGVAMQSLVHWCGLMEKWFLFQVHDLLE